MTDSRRVPWLKTSQTTSDPKTRRHAVAGVLLLAMIGSAVLANLLRSVFPIAPMAAAAICAWAAAVLLVIDVSRAQRLQVALIALAGAGLLWFGYLRGARPEFAAIFGNNTGLLTMIAAVGFLRLVAVPKVAAESASPVGAVDYFKTLLGVSLFGSVINISAPLIIADYLSERRPLGRFTSQSITRVFSGCSSWSPFFGGMAVVLTYVPDARLGFLMLACLPFAVTGLLLVLLEAYYRYPQQLAVFQGYPVRFGSLWVPVTLALAVVLLSRLMPELSILIAITIAALLVTVAVLAIRGGVREAYHEISRYVRTHLARMVNELLLFLAAGVLAAGLASVIATGVIILPDITFSATAAVGLLAIMVLMSVGGVHPVITVSGATPLLQTLEPSQNLLAVTYLLAWSLGTCAGPLSGTHLVFQGRYGIPSWQAAVWNWPYVIAMYLVAIPLLFVVSTYL